MMQTHPVVAAAAVSPVSPGGGAIELSPDAGSALLANSKKHALAPHPSSSMPSTAMKITYRDLIWTVDIPNTDPATKKQHPQVQKQVLKGVSGTFRPGRMTAILGSSGAGKTTLLNVIAGYAYGGTTSGDLLVNGEAIGQSSMREMSGFVHQADVILPTMTVREAVRMAAYLRLPKSMSNEMKDARVEEVLRWLNLVKVAENQIGSPEKKGISGGERRRVSIAMEMVRNPSILYLDEPTSGLDSFTSYAVAHLLHTVAHTHHRTIVATIHQPSSEVFALFDDLVLLNQGQVIYHGPASEAMAYFAEHLGYQIPKYTNPADFIFMHILNGAGGKSHIGTGMAPVTPESQRALAPGFDEVDLEKSASTTTAVTAASTVPASQTAEVFAPSLVTVVAAEAARAAEAEREQRIIDAWNAPSTKTRELPRQRQALDRDVAAHALGGSRRHVQTVVEHAAFWTQLQFLCARAWADATRNPLKMRGRFFQAAFFGLIASLAYLQVGHGQASVQNRKGVLFFLSGSGMMSGTIGTLTIFASEKDVFQREYASKMYSLPAFFWSKFAMELPFRIIAPIIQSLILYWAVGLHSDPGVYFTFLATLILIDLVASGVGILFACIFPSLPVALAGAPMILLPMMLFSGFFLNADSIPPYFNWLSYISPIKYGFMSLVRNEFTGLTFTCDAGEKCTYRTGEQVIEQLSFYGQPSLPADEAILLALACAMYTAAYFALWRTSRKL